MVSIRKLRTFQDLGHTVVFLLGDFTALVGDPSGRSETRPRLSEAEVTANAATYKEQVFKVLDPQRTVIERNSRWLRPLSLPDILTITSHYTVARLLERDDFAKRFAAGNPISLFEFLYPLLRRLRLGGAQGRRRDGRHRPEVQPAGRAHADGALRDGAAGRVHHAAAARHRRRAQDVTVVRQLHRDHRAARGPVRQGDVHSGHAAGGVDHADLVRAGGRPGPGARALPRRAVRGQAVAGARRRGAVPRRRGGGGRGGALRPAVQVEAGARPSARRSRTPPPRWRRS